MWDWDKRGKEATTAETLSAVAQDFCARAAGDLPQVVPQYKLGNFRGKKVRWLLDGGSTNHCINLQSLIFNKTGESRRLSGICGAEDVDVVNLKTLKLGSPAGTASVQVMGALYSKKLALNILSENRLLSDGWRFGSKKDYMFHRDRPQLRVQIEHRGGLQWIVSDVPDIELRPVEDDEIGFDGGDLELVNVSGDETVGSASDGVEGSSTDGQAASGMKIPKWLLEHITKGHIDLLPPGMCPPCDATRRGRRKIRRRRRDVDQDACLQGLCSIDLCGPLPMSISGKRYLCVIVNHDTNEVVPYFLKTKSSSDVTEAFEDYVRLRGRPRLVRTDGGKEFAGKFSKFLADSGVQQRYSSPYTPQLNGKVEVYNRILLGLASTNLQASGAPLGHWPSAVTYVAGTLNRIGRKVNGGKSSFEIRTGKAPDNSFFRPFWTGGHYLPLNPNDKRESKIEPMRRRCRLLSYCLSMRGYRVWDEKDQKIVRTLDCIWDQGGHVNLQDVDGKPTESTVFDKAMKDLFPDDKKPDGETLHEDMENNNAPGSEDSDGVLDEFGCYVGAPEVSMTAEEATKLDGDDIDRDFVAKFEAAYGATISIKEALADTARRDQWMEAISNECRAVDSSWEWCKPPPGARILPTRLIMNHKEVEDRYKARLVVIGFLEYLSKGVSVYTPTVMSDTVRICLTIGQALGLPMHQADISTAFLLASVPEGIPPIYVQPPAGYIPASEHDRRMMESGHCWVLKRALYGLKRSPQWWGLEFSKTAKKEWEMIRCEADRCLYVKRSKCGRFATLLLVYVDDLLAIGDEAKEVIDLVRKKWKIRDLGPIKDSDFLGCNVERDKDFLYFSQRRYANKVIQRFGLSEKGVPTPLLSKLLFDSGEELPRDNDFRSRLGASGWLATMTRPDLSFAQNHLARAAASPRAQHMAAMKHYLRYIGGTAGSRLKMRRFHKGEKFRLSAYVDSDWKGDVEEGQSTGGHILDLNGMIIIWKSKTFSKTVKPPKSSTEAEYIQLSNSCDDVAFVQNLFNQFLSLYDERMVLQNKGAKVTLREDNKGAIDIANGDGGNKLRYMAHKRFSAPPIGGGALPR